MQHQDMLRMANQIASFFNGSGPEAAIRDAAEHISKFWDPRMRAVLVAHLDKGGEGLDATIVLSAIVVLVNGAATASSRQQGRQPLAARLGAVLRGPR